MGKLNEIFGLTERQWRSQSLLSPITTTCPYSEGVCDGGGNRHQTSLKPSESLALQQKISHPAHIPLVPGVCSIKTGDSAPWIVCPRRLFSPQKSPSLLESRMVALAGISTPYAIWSEISFRVGSSKDGDNISYRFDYVISEVRNSQKTQPVGPPLIVEVMTASTSGSNTAQGTDIKSAFLNSLDGDFAVGPGINKRQVWARMASQLIAKSELAVNWGGATTWLLQDNLLAYIAQTTSLDLTSMISDSLEGVNLLSIGYSEGPLDFEVFAAQLSPNSEKGVYGLFHTPIDVPLGDLHKVLAKKPFVLRASEMS